MLIGTHVKYISAQEKIKGPKDRQTKKDKKCQGNE